MRVLHPTPALLSKVVDLLDHVPMEDRDTKGDLYEYMLSKIASAGQNGQFRTPRHIIRLMVELTAPNAKDVICDPASGTCGFLVAAGEYLREKHPEILRDAQASKHFHHDMFHGYDFDNTMLRIGSMNMMLHGVENPDIRYQDSLAEDHAGDEEKYSLILANPPFAGSLDYENTAKDLLAIVKTKKTELLFLALFLRLLKPGGRAAIIVPDGVLFGSSKAHKQLRQMLVEDQKLDAVISLPSGAFKPYAGVSTAILIFTKTNSGGTDNVWFYNMQADGWSLDDKRQPLLPEEKLGVTPAQALTEVEHGKNNLPDVLSRWLRLRSAQGLVLNEAEVLGLRLRSAQGLVLNEAEVLGLRSLSEVETKQTEAVRSLSEVETKQTEAVRSLSEVETKQTEVVRSLSEVETNDAEMSEITRPRTEQSFCVPKAEIAANGYDLSINRYKEVVHEVVEHLPPKVIMANLAKLEAEIQSGMKKLEELLASTPLSQREALSQRESLGQREALSQSETHSQPETPSGRAIQQSQTNLTAP
jgi:type I restriction enzyme M protein